MARIDPDRQVEADGGRGLSQRDLLLIAGLAAVPRLAGLGHVSLWLDEILGTLQTSGSLAQTWEELKGVRVHPPLWGLVNWLTQLVTESEPLRRLVPIAFGIATILLLADLVSRKCGRATALFAATIAAFSPLHIRYSQELRAYSLGLLMLVLAIWLLDRAVERGRPRDWVLFSVSIWVGLSSLYLVAIVLVPAVILVLSARKPLVERRRDLRKLAAAFAVACLACAPWYSVVGNALEKEHELPATRWTLELAVQRWHFLTAASQEGEAANLGSLALGLVALLGATIAFRSRGGRVVLAGLLVGTVGVELLLALLNHWSNGRYSIAAWPFLVVILALGCQGIMSAAVDLRLAERRFSRRLRLGFVPVLVVLGVVGVEGPGGVRYYQNGRPDWLGLARELSLTVPSPRTIWVSNEWTRISLGFYIAQLEDGARARVSSRVQIAGPPTVLAANDFCVALVVAGYPERPELNDLFDDAATQKHYPRSGARLLALPGLPAGSEERWRCFPAELDARAGERPPSLWGIPLEPSRPERRLEMVERDASQLLFGWSFAERNREGISFRWTVGHWAAVRLPAVGGRLLMRVWAFEDGQRLTVYRNRLPVGDFPLQRQQQEIELDWPSAATVDEGEVVYFHFAEVAPLDRVDRPLAAGFDRIEIVESAPSDPRR